MLPPECAPTQRPCPHCGQLMPGSTPAADPPSLLVPAKNANVASEPPSGYMSRPKLT